MLKFICEDVDENGNAVTGTGCGEIDHVLFDGYGFGDRTLEGVTFKAFIRDGKIAVDSVEDWDNCPYLSTLNKKHWMDEALDYAKNNDIADCPKCGNQIDAQPTEK